MKLKSNPFVRSLRFPMSVFTIALSAAALSLDSAWAAAWDGSASTDWNTGANWDTNVVPSGVDAFVGTNSPNIATITGNVPNVGQLLVGTGGSTGTVNHNAGSLTAGSWLVLGSGGGTSVYNLANTATTGGTLTGFGTGSGSLTKNGGGDFYIGENAGTNGTLNINTTGGVSSSSFTVIGQGGTGTVNLDAGSFNTTAWLALGAAGGTGTLNMSGGAVNQGTSDANSRLELTNPGSAGNATVNLNGGVLAVNGIVASGNGAGNVLINLNGGTLKANITNSGFIADDAEIDRINVRNGGAVIDTNGKDIGIGEALLHSNIGGDLSKDGGLTKSNTTGTLTLSNVGNTFNGDILVSGGTLAAGGGITGNTAANIGSVLGEIGTSASRTITVGNGGILSLTAANTLGTGGSTGTLAGVTLVVNSGGLFQTGTNAAGAGYWNKIGAVNLTGGTISVGSGANNSDFQGLALIGTVTVSGTAASTINNLGSSDSAFNSIHLGQNATANQSITFDVADVTSSSATDLTISAKLRNTSSTGTASGLTKIGVGTMLLTGVNTYTGATNINAGTLSVSANNNLGANAAAVSLNGGTLKTTAGFTNTHAITVGGAGGAINIATTGQLFMDTANTLLGSGTLNLTGNGTLAGIGTGNFRVNQTNTFNGAVNISSGGNFEYGVSGAVDAAATFNIGNEAEFALQGFVATTSSNAITVSGGTNSVLSFENGNGGTYAGAITLNANVTVGLRDWYNITVARSGTVSGVISGVGGITTDRGTTGAATLTVSGVNTYTGNTSIGTGTTFSVGGAGQLGSGSYAGNIANAGTFKHDSSANQTLSGAVSGAGTVTKTGTGTLVLAGSNTYTGLTTVDGGKLLVNGSNTGEAGYSVGASGTLGGTGSLGSGAVNVTGVLSPGASVQTLSSGTVNLLTGSTFAYEVDSSVGNSSGADLQIISGDLTLTGTVTLTMADLALSPTAYTEGTTFSLFNYSGGWNSGIFTFGGNAIADDSTFTAGLNTWQIDYNAANGGENFNGEYLGGSDSFVNITAVPEPASAVLGGLGLLALLRRRRK